MTSTEQACSILVQLQAVTEDNAKKNKELRLRVDNAKGILKKHMESMQLRTIPIGRRYAVLKDKVTLHPVNDEFLRCVIRTFFRTVKSMELTEADVDSFMLYIRDSRQKLSTKTTTLVITSSQPLESIL